MKVKGIILQSKPMKTKNNASYLQVVLCDGTTKYSVSVWNSYPKDLKVGDCCLMNLKESDGFYSATIKDVEIIPEVKELTLLLPRCVSKEEWDSCILELGSVMKNNEAEVFYSLADKVYPFYKEATAARSHHHAFIGGLLQHTYELLKMFTGLYSKLPFAVNPFVVSVAALMHDFGKLSEYTREFDYKPDFFLLGHPYMSAEAAKEYLKYYKVDPLTVKHIQHCILAHHKKLEFGSPVLPATKEAFIVAELDELSGVGVQYDQETGTKACNTTIYNFT